MSLLNLLEEFNMFEKIRKMKNKKGFHPGRAHRRSGYPGHPCRPAGSGSDWLHRQGEQGEGCC